MLSIKEDKSIALLVVEDQDGDFELLKDAIESIKTYEYFIDRVSSLKDAQSRVQEKSFDAVLLDLGLPDSQGLNNVYTMTQAKPELPLVVLTAYDNEEVAMQAIHAGAQDYLVKGIGDGYLMERAVRYAIERKELEKNLFRRANYDQLTGAVTRDLFTNRLQQTLARTKRNSTHVTLLFIDVDNFKVINDRFGHKQGDLLLQHIAAILMQTVRENDTVARFGDDEFLVILDEIKENPETSSVAAVKRILAALKENPFMIDGDEMEIRLSIGGAIYQAEEAIDTLIQRADEAMYYAKNNKDLPYYFSSL